MTLDLVINNGTVIDGIGRPRFLWHLPSNTRTVQP